MESEHEIRERRKLNLFEKGLSLVNPQAALDRAQAREALHEFAAVKRGSRARGRPATLYEQGSSESWKKQRERYDSIWEARAMEESFCIISGVLDRVTQYAFGETEYHPATGGGGKVDQLFADYFHDWCGEADVTGRHRFNSLIQLSFRAAVRDGQFGFVEHMIGQDYRLQGIEADRIGNPQDLKQDEKNINGIHLGEFGQVLKYDIYKRNRNSKYTLEGSVTPKRFMHLFFPTRIDQYHGVSRLAPALPHARDLYELLGHEKVAAKFAASWAAFVRQKDASAPGSFKWNESKDGGKTPPSMPGMPGQVIRLDGQTEDISFAPGTQRPSGAFMALVEALIRELALGLDLPYGFVYDLSRLGGVTARIEIQAVMRKLRWYQRVVTDTILDRVKRRVLMLGIAKGDLPLVPDWDRGSWRFGQTLTGDVGHQTTADLALVEAGAKSISQVAADYNNDFRTLAEQKASEVQIIQEVAEQKEVPIEFLARWLDNPTATLAALERARTGEPDPDAPPPPPPGLIGVVGEKGLKPLLDIIEQVGKGEIDRDTAVLSVRKIYGLSLRQAMELVPMREEADPVVDSGKVDSPPKS